MSDSSSQKIGISWGILAFGTWGFVPIYWKFFKGVGFLEILGHRIIWASVFLAILMMLKNEMHQFLILLKSKKNVITLCFSTLLIFFNWSLFIWAVYQNYIVECSLGYFITPLINVLLGVFILKEKLTKDQWVSVFFAAIGIIILLLQGIGRPEISLGLGLSFGLYGLIKKRGNVEALPSLFFETVVLFIPALITFIYLHQQNNFHFVGGNLQNTFLSIGAGLVTLIPLLAFGKAVRMVPLTTIGIMQYIAPTLQLLSGVFLFHEPFTKIHFFSFCFIWMGLIIYTVGSFSRYQQRKAIA